MGALLLAQALSGEGGGWLAALTKPPRRVEVAPEGAAADSYSPAGAPARGCVALVHGMTTMGRRDPRLEAFARALARLGFWTVAPDLPGMRRLRPEEGDVLRIGRIIRWMTGGGAGAFRKCGLLAFSFAAGPALRAAAGAGERVSAFVGVGAYYDLKNVIRHLTTSGGQNRPAFPGGPPVRHGKWLFLRYNAKLLGLEAFQRRIGEIAERKRADEAADASDLLADLPERARALVALMENEAPHRFEALYARQDAGGRERLRRWGMREVVPKVRAPMFFLHGRGDPFVPASESVLLANRAREAGREEVSLLVLDGFRHVGMGESVLSPGGILDGLRFLGFVSAALSAMEG